MSKVSEWLYSTGYYYYRIESDRIVASMSSEVAENSVIDRIFVDIPSNYKARLEMTAYDRHPVYKLYVYGFNNNCYHEYTDYVGLNEVYRFCKKCNKKENQSGV